MNRPTVNNKVLNEILEKSKTSSGMYSQEIFKDILRFLIGTFSDVRYVDRNNNVIKVKCFHANQERAIAKSTLGDNITLPVITISENSTESNQERNKYSSVLMHEVYFDQKKQRAIRLLSLSPRAIDINYTINIWAKYKQDLDQIREYILLLFNPDLEIPNKSGDSNKAYFISESEVEQAEAEDTQDRILKRSINIAVETYIPNPKFLYTSTGKIEKFNYEYEIDTSGL
jgi:hypothetical protein